VLVWRLLSLVQRQEDRLDNLGFGGFFVPLQALEFHAFQDPVFNHETLRRVILDDADSLLVGIFQLPRRGLEVRTRPPRHDLRIDTAQPA